MTKDQHKSHWPLYSLWGAAVAAGIGPSLVWASYPSTGLPLQSYGILLGIVYWFTADALIGLVIAGWLTIPAAILIYANFPTLSHALRAGRNKLWTLLGHYGFGIVVGFVLPMMGLRLPTI